MKELNKAKKAKIYLVNEDGTLGSEVTTLVPTGLITIPAHTSQIDLPKMNLSSVITEDKVYTFRLVEVDGTDNHNVATLAEFTLDAHTKAMDTVKLIGLKGNRPASSTGSVSFRVQSEDEIVKAYYVKKVNTAATSDSVAPAVNDFKNTDGTYKGTINVSNNKVEEAQILLTDESVYEDKTFDVYFLLEDKYGNVSKTVLTEKALIPWEKDGSTSVATEIAEAKITDVATVKELADVKLTWKLVDNAVIGSNTFTVVLYRDGEAIGEQKAVEALETNISAFTATSTKPLKAGTYYFEAYSEGAGNKLPSATIKSNETTVSKLNAVSKESIKFDVDKLNNSIITWNASTSPAEEVKEYAVELYGYNTGTKKYDTQVTVTDSPATKTEVSGLTAMLDNTLYQANVTVKATGDKLSLVDSDVTISKEFFKVYTPVVDGTPNSNTVTFKITGREVSGMTPSYRVKVYLYNVDDPQGLFEGKYKEVPSLAQDVTVKADGTFEVKGLEEGTQYVIRLYATVNGIEGVSGYSRTFSTRLAIPSIVDKKVIADDTTTKTGEIAKTTNGISIDGIEYKTSDYPAELGEIQSIVDALVEGDVLTYKSDAVTVKLGAFSTSDTLRNRALSTTIGDRDLYLENGSYSQVVTGTVGGNVIISGNNESLDITSLTSAKEIKINAGSTIKGAKEVVVVANEGKSSVNFMDKNLKVNVSADTTLDLTTLVKITAVPNNNITLNSTTTNALVVTISGDGTDTEKQYGKVDITATGDVTVTADSLALYAPINVNVTDGNVTLTGANLLGAQSVTMKNTTSSDKTITAKAATVAPFEISGAIDIKEYVLSDVNTLKTNVTAFASVTDTDEQKEMLDSLNSYLETFASLFGTEYNGATKYGAKITKAKGNEVTLTLNKTVDSRENEVAVTIDGLMK